MRFRALSASAFYAAALAFIAPSFAQTVVIQNGGSGRASTVEESILRGQGAFLRGASWYNLRTAQANSINVDSTIRWKQDLRKIQQERQYQEAQKKYDKNRNIEEFKKQMAQREQELRTNPSPGDVQSGAALNALVYDLTDPDFTSYQWNSRSIPLPAGASVKELIFSFTPHSVSTQASAALSKGVIALSRLDIKDKWPAVLKKDELAKERQAYEAAYQRARDKVVRGDYAAEEILALDAALDALRRKISVEIPNERGFRTEANKFVEDLRDATRMFDANSVDYAREILIDTKDHDAASVQELVEFMTKYRLQFANSERSPTARVLYGDIYEKLRDQLNAIRSTPNVALLPVAPAAPAASGKPTAPKQSSAKGSDEKWVSLFNGKDLTGWRPSNDWGVNGGMIADKPPQGDRTERLETERRSFANFHLRFEAKTTGTGQVWIHLRIPDSPDKPFYRCYILNGEITLRSSLGEGGTTTVGSKGKGKANGGASAGKWFTEEIIADGDMIRISIDGTEVASFRDPEQRASSGGIAIAHAKPAGVRIRKMEIRELP